MLLAPLARAEETVRCESDRGRYRYCNVGTHNRVSIQHQLSSTGCRLGDNWGYDRHGVWVDRGCRAEFRVGKSSHHSDKDAAVAVGAVAGLALIAALAAKKVATTPKSRHGPSARSAATTRSRMPTLT
jgi:hypothetical protein